MPRAPRVCHAESVYHVINRGVRRQPLFHQRSDYERFQWLMGRAAARTSLRLLAYCLMPNHWHLVVWPDSDSAVSAYVHWLGGERARHYNEEHQRVGHVYQGRFRSILVRDPVQLMTLLRYVESNALRGGLVERADEWRWSSLVTCRHIELAEPPCPRPPGWLDILAEFALAESTARARGPGPFREMEMR